MHISLFKNFILQNHKVELGSTCLCREIHGGWTRGRWVYERRNDRYPRTPCHKEEHRKMEGLPIYSRYSFYRTDLHLRLISQSTDLLVTSPANECCERLAYYGMSTNLVSFMEDILNQGNTSAANNVTNWSGTCYITPLLGAFLADSYLGRFWTIASFMVIYIIVRPLCWFL